MLFTRRDLIKMVLPLLIQQILMITIGMVDTMMIAYAGDVAVSGVSLVGSLDNMLVIVFSSMTSGGVVVVSQLLGSKNIPAARNGAKQLLYSSTIVAVALSVFVLILRKPLLTVLFGSAEADVLDSADDYFFFVALSFPALAIQSACQDIQRTEGKMSMTMWTSVGANLVNVLGNAILIIEFEMGAAGAAIATLISRVIAAVVMLIAIQHRSNTLCVKRLFHYRPDYGMIRKILRVGIPSGIEDGMFRFGKLLTQSLISTMPTAVIAANAVANTLVSYQYMPGSAISGTMIPVVGRCIGAHKPEQVKKYSRQLTMWTYLLLWGFALATLLLAGPLVGLYDLSDESTQIAKQLIFYHSIFAMVIWPIGFTIPSAFRGVGDVKYPMLISILSMWVFRVILAYPMALEQVTVLGVTIPGLNMGVMGVWVAMTVDWVFRAVLFLIRYLRGRWLRVKSLVD